MPPQKQVPKPSTQKTGLIELPPEYWHPEHVERILSVQRDILQQDFESLRSGWRIVAMGKWAGHETVSAIDYLRNGLLIYRSRRKKAPTNATPIAWLPYILQYCETLGIPSDAIEDIFQRLVRGEVLDQVSISDETKRANEQLLLAIEVVNAQYRRGESMIRPVQAKELSGLFGKYPFARSFQKEKARVESLVQSIQSRTGKKAKILIQMWQHRVIESADKVPADIIAKWAVDQLAGAVAIKKEMSALKKLGLVDSDLGRGHGSRLTEIGGKVARELIRRSELK